MIRPGNFNVVPNGSHHGKPSFHVLSPGGSDNVKAWRDLNHDGFYSGSEKKFARRNGVTATEILFHVGFSSPSSIGCQTLSPSQMPKLIKAVGGSNARFNFTLVER